MTLSPKQKAIVTLLSQGHTAQEIADIKCRALPTVRRHIQIAIERSGARNTPQLVAISISRGWIAPLVLVLLISDLHNHAARVRLPTRTRETVSMVRAVGRIEGGIAA